MSYVLNTNYDFKDSAKRQALKAVETVDVSGPGWADKFMEAIDNLSENKTSIKEESLDIIIRVCLCHDASSEIESRLDELLALLKKSITKYGSVKESTQACRAIALVFITLGELNEELFTRIAACLQNTAKNAEELDIKLSCLQALSVITYVGASKDNTQLIREYLFELIETDAAEFNVGSLSSNECETLFAETLKYYGVLFASSFAQGMVDFHQLWEEVEKVLPFHELLLESSNKEIRIAAGENIALMFECVHVFTKSSADEDALIEDAPRYDNMNGLINSLKGLSVDSSRQKSKNDRAEQKSVFRDILKSVEDNERPVENIKIGHMHISFRGWAKILGLNLFRGCLGQGFQYHLKANDVLKQKFHYDYDYSETNDDALSAKEAKINKAERKLLFEEDKKSRSKNMRSARTGKDNDEVY